MLSSINLLIRYGAFFSAFLLLTYNVIFSFPIHSDNYIPTWTNATVPYQLMNTFTSTEASVIFGVFEEISRKTCVKFVPVSNETDFVQIRKGLGCHSSLGRVGGFQVIYLQGGSGSIDHFDEANSCVRHGLVAYRVMQTLGFYPEHVRPDRDEYVRIHWENVKTGKRHAFAKYRIALFNLTALPYDYGSVKHGELDMFAAENDTMTIVPTKYGASIGQKHGLSNGDIQKIRHVYCTANESIANDMLLLLALFCITVNSLNC